MHDPVHGRVWLTAVEIELVNTPEFQRLRRISQLEPVDSVFPGATHSRFAHSIGATHVMGMILRQQAFEDHFEERPHMFQVLRLAALLHDIGHLPFSHVGEVAWNVSRYEGWEGYAEDDDRTVFDVVAAGSPGAYHERLSALIVRSDRIRDIINRHIPEGFGEGSETLTAADLVARTINTLPNEADPGDVVVRNLLSSDVDCDRLDYLLRDSFAAGLPYGHVDLSYLIGNLEVVEDEKIGPLVALNRKHGMLPGEHYLLCRYYHYAQLVGHKTSGAAEMCLSAGILELIRRGKLPSAKELEAALREGDSLKLMGLLDDTVMGLFTGYRQGDAGDDVLKECAQRVLERKLLKVAVYDDNLEKMKQPGDRSKHPWDLMLPKGKLEKKLDVAAKCDVEPSSFCYKVDHRPLSGISPDTSTTDAVKENEKFQARWTKAAKLARPDGGVELLARESPVLRAIAKHQWSTRRVFVREPLALYEGGSSARSAEFERIRAYFEAELEPA